MSCYIVQFADGTFGVRTCTHFYFNFRDQIGDRCWCERASLRFIKGDCKGTREEAQRVYDALTEQEMLL